VNDKNHVTVGHATSPLNVLKVMCQCIVRQLFKNHGTEFVSFLEKPNAMDISDDTIYQIRLVWQNSPSATNTTYSFVGVTETKTYQQVVVEFYDAVLLKKQAVLTTPMLQRAELLLTNVAQNKAFQLLASVDIRRMLCHWSFYSSIRIQNKTLTGSGTALTDQNNVNPCEGRVYFQKKGKNWFEPSNKIPELNQGNYRGWVPYSSVGSWNDWAANSQTTGYEEPPTKNMVGASKVQKFTLHPGQVMTDSLGMKGKIYFNTFLNLCFGAIELQSAVLAADPQVPAEFGTARAYNFEKLVFDRKENQDVTVGYEVNQNYTVFCTFKKMRADPITWVEPYVSP